MIEWIILHYIKPGEVIVDPMAGTYSTCVIATINNRHGIGAELEDKFYNWGLEAKRRVEQIPTLAPKGRMVVLNGDARELSKILTEKAVIDADAVVFSPPFFSVTEERGDKRTGKHDIAAKMLRGDPQHKGIYLPYVGDERNIHKLREYGAAAVILSPPFASAEFDCKHGIKKLGPNLKGRKVWEGKYKATLGKDNIGRLSYGTLPDGGGLEVSAFVFSPPFAEAIRGGGIAKHGYDKDGKHDDLHLRHDRALSDAPENISNMPYGEVDAIITSPPYSEALRKIGAERTFKKQVPHDYSDNEQNIGNLRHGNADAIVTSPPYEGSVSDIVKGRTSAPMGGKYGTLKRSQTYSLNPDNIGNLKADTYLDAMLQVYRECFKVLKPGGVMVLITKNFIRNKKIVRLDLDTIKLCETAGFKFIERWYRKLEHPSFWRIIYAKKFNYCPQCTKVYRVRNATTDTPSLIKCPKCQAKLKPALIDVEDILVFRKPAASMCPACGKHELVPHPSDTLLCPECGFIKTEGEK